ncbi:glycosyltransferase [Fluviibacterium sp. DFM31]|uniref:Glycosyltransferase n=1 Tax=Meridianimarinicoccus marinus TaxID=3231483 RepID=A0ABV3L1A6_9RHOB
MTDTPLPVTVRFEITQGGGDLYLATVSITALRRFLTGNLTRIEVVIPDPDLREDAQKNWPLVQDPLVRLVAATSSDADAEGITLVGAPIVMLTRPVTLDAGFVIEAGGRRLTCDVAGAARGETPDGVHSLPRLLGPSGQIQPGQFPDLDAQEIADLSAEIRHLHHNGYFWDYRYRNNPDLGSGVGSRGVFQGIKRELLNRNVVAPGLSVVDIGCGDLEVVRALNFNRYIGVDEAPRALELGRQKRPDWEFRQAPLDVSGGPVAEAALCFEVLIHAPSAQAADRLIDTLARAASKRIVISGYDHPVPQSPIVYFHAPLKDMLWALEGWQPPVLIARYENLSVYAVDREGSDLPPPVAFEPRDLEPFTWDMLGTLGHKLDGLTAQMSRLTQEVSGPAPEQPQPDPGAEAPKAPVIAKGAPLISVVVTCYNEAAHIDALATALRAQTETGFEVHFLDDGSQDGTVDILQAHAAQDQRLVITQDGRNLGPSARRNEGMAAARGRYLYFADGDDLVEPQALDRLLSLMLGTDAEVSRGAHLFCTPEGKQQLNQMDQYHQPEAYGIGYAQMPSLVFLYTVWNTLIDRHLLVRHDLRFDSALRLGEDRLFLQQVFAAARGISLTKDATYRWIRQTEGGTHLSFSRSVEERLASVAAYLDGVAALKGAGPRHLAYAHAAMFWEIYTRLIETGELDTLTPEARQSLAGIAGKLDFPEDLLGDRCIKGWAERREPRAREVFRQLRRNGGF